MSIDLRHGGRVTVRTPQPTVTVRPPATRVAVLPLRGPAGPSGADSGAADLAEHIKSPTPHAAYDDIPSLVLFLENGMA